MSDSVINAAKYLSARRGSNSVAPQITGVLCQDDCILKVFGRIGAGGLSQVTSPNEQNGVVTGITPEAPVDWTSSDIDRLYLALRPWQTRVVKLLPARAAEPLKCELLTVEFVDMEGVGISGSDDVIHYEALSYSWESRVLTRSITCNGVALPLTSNLWRALCQLRKTDHPRYIWCDAICIDQRNLLEKSQQVKNMLRIFEKAKAVIAWLGHFPPEYCQVLRKLQQEQASNPIVHITTQMHSIECIQGLGLVHGILRGLSECSWVVRTWVRQEVFAAKNLDLYSGTSRLPYLEYVELACYWLSTHVVSHSTRTCRILHKHKSATTAGVLPGLGLSPAFGILYEHFQHRGTDKHDFRPPEHRCRYSVHWLRSLQAGVSFQVTDPRDRVYGALGIITSPTTRLYVESRPNINPDAFPISYQKSVSEVYQDVVKYLINMDGNLDCLMIVEDRRGRASDIPSWVPDWRHNIKRSFVDLPPDEPNLRRPSSLAAQQDMGDRGRLILWGLKFFNIRSLHVADISEFQGYERIARRSGRTSMVHEATLNTWYWMDTKLPEILKGEAYVKTFLKEVGNVPTANADFQLFVPRTSMIDDVLVALKGARCLFVLRPAAEGKYQLVGPALFSGKYGGPIAAVDLLWRDGDSRSLKAFLADGTITWPIMYTGDSSGYLDLERFELV